MAINGTTGNDTLTGTKGADTIYGLAGNDYIFGDDGNDYLDGGSGDDTVDGGVGNDTIFGGAGSDSLIGGDGDDKLYKYAESGSSFLSGGAGADTIQGGLGNDTIDGGTGDDAWLEGYAGNDLITGGDGNDKLYGDEGSDTLDGGAGNDYLDGGDGNDTLDGGAGDNVFRTGDGIDSITSGSGNDNVNGFLADATKPSGTYTFYTTSGAKNISTGAGDDFIYGSSGADTIDAGDGNDVIYGGGGNDSINGGSGDDYVYHQTSNNATLLGGAGNDYISTYGGTGNKYLDGGADDDTLEGSSGDDTLIGGAGNDYLDGGSGNNSLEGGAGNDSIYGGIGNDTYVGGGGNDYLADTGGNNYFDAGAGNDTVYGDSGNDSIFAGDGNDYVLGWTGDDLISGGSGDDYLSGGSGSDTLDGGTGADTLNGGLGNDTYYVDSQFDYIVDQGGTDTAYVSKSFVKIPSTLEKENVHYVNGAQALPYWIDALLPDEASGLSFSSFLGTTKTFNFSFPTSIPTYDTSIDHAKGWAAFTAVQQIQVKAALTYISSVIGLNFVQTLNANAPNCIAFANNDQSGSSGYAQYPSVAAWGSDLFLDNSSAPNNINLANGTYGAYTLIHEIGHTLGLKHPGNYDATGGGNDPPYLVGVEDSTTWTVMSYTYYSANYYLVYSPLDIAALQYLYGPSATVRTTDDTYQVSASSSNFIWDGAGKDTITLASVSKGATIYLTPGYWGYVGNKSSLITDAGQVTVNFGTTIEQLVGSSYADSLYGNEANNTIDGGAGNDAIEGWDGNDSLIGGLGVDTLTGGIGDDSLDGGDGADTACFSGKYADYKLRYDQITGICTVTDNVGTDGSDSLLNIETLKFVDKSVALSSLDMVSPSVVTFKPASSGLAMVKDNILITFSELIAIGSGSLSLITAAGNTVATYDIVSSTNLTLAGTTLIVNPTADLTYSTTYTVTISSGIVKDIAGNSLASGSSYSFTTAAPVAGKSFSFNAGNDAIIGTIGSDTIDGGAGIDTVSYSGVTSCYTISRSGTTATVSSGADGLDTLVNVERLKFSDSAIALDIDGTAGQCYRIYKAAFARTPDLGGVGYWISVMDKGTSLQSVAGGFIDSAEFKSVYGTNPTNDALVTKFYTNVLGRAPDATGAVYWTGILNNKQDTVANVLANISESAENKASLVGVIGNGFEYTPYV